MGEDGKIVYKVVIDDKGVQTEAEQAGQRAGDSFGKGAGTMEEVWTGAARRIGEAFVNVAAEAAKAAGKLLVGSIQTGMDFDAAMSQVAATLGYTTEQLHDSTTQQAQDFQALRDFAREMGKTTAFTAQQSAEALNYMALAGYDAETSMKMLPTVLNLAAAGGMDLARASDAVTDIQSAFGLSIEDTVKLVDQMAKTAQRTNTSVSQLAEGMLTVGGTAKFMRGGTAEVAEVLGLMASAGIKGAEGGTHLRNILNSLAAPTEKGAQALEDVGVAIFDAEGKMRSFSDIMPELSKALDGLTDEEKLDFFDKAFNVRDIAAVNALLGASADTWNRLGNEIRNSEGAAEEMASVQLDNLKGDVTKLKSEWGNFTIELADKFAPILRQIMPQLLALIERLTERVQNADWSNLGDKILEIAEKLIGFLEWIIDHADVVLGLFEKIGTALLVKKGASFLSWLDGSGSNGGSGGGWLSSILGGAGGAVTTSAATGAATGAAASSGASAAAGAAVETAGATAFNSLVLSGLPLVGLAYKVTKVMSDLNAQVIEEYRAGGRIENGTIEEYQALVAQLESDQAAAVDRYNELNANISADSDMNAVNEAANDVYRLGYELDEARRKLSELEAQTGGTLEAPIDEVKAIAEYALLTQKLADTGNYMGDGVFDTEQFQEDANRLGELQAEYGKQFGQLTEQQLAEIAELVSAAMPEGEDMMSSFAAGIEAGANTFLAPALEQVAQLINSYLHHSTPDVGPLANDDTWMPDMMQGWARQIRDYAPELSGALSFALPTRADFERSVSVNIAARGNIGARSIEVPLVVSGREIARATAWDMGEQLAWEEM